MNPWCIKAIDMTIKKDLSEKGLDSQRGIEAAICKNLLAGCAGGLAGGWTMSQFTRLWRTLSGSTELLPYSRQEWDAVSGIANATFGRILGRRLPEREQKIGAAIVHYVMAGAAGALYGVTSARRRPRTIKWSGALFGIGMWVLGNELLMPALRLTAKPSHYSLRMQANSLGEHLVFGLTTGFIYYSFK